MRPLQVIAGHKFGRLTVKSDVLPKTGHHRRISCVCDCGAETTVILQNLTRGRTISCGCQQGEKWKKPTGASARHHLYLVYKKNAKVRNLPFSLTLEEFSALTASDCTYCGSCPATIHVQKRSNGNYTHNGIDRVDNSQGYTSENAVPCCRMCNVSKNIHDFKTFKNWVGLVYKTLYKE